jgi:hypothetical protein
MSTDIIPDAIQWSRLALVLVVLVAVYCINRWIITSMRVRSQYVRMFRAQGYKVIELPFKPLGAPYFEMIAKDTE